MQIQQRYASAVHSSNLRSAPATTASDSDVLGAAGLAAKPTRRLRDGKTEPGRPLSIALARLLAGDNRASKEIASLLAVKATGKAFRMQIELSHAEALDMGAAVLAWWRDGVCKPCGGHGYKIVPGTPSLSGTACPACKGAGKRPFDSEFSLSQLIVAQWLLDETEREVALAGQAAMRALAPTLTL